MQKPFVVVEGKIYYPRKPLYRQPLFWTSLLGGVLSFVLFINGLIMGLPQDNNLSSSGSSFESEDYWEDWSEYEIQKIGEPILIDEQISVTLIRFEKDRTIRLVDEWEDVAVVAEVTLENSSDQVYYLDESFFQLQDGDGYEYELDGRTYDVNIPEKIEVGETVTLKLIFAAMDEDDYKLRFDELVWEVEKSVHI